jgi:NAD(P)-dependent dehydrogenase (short-subunit alcohol dehydrogenase family)
MSKSMKPSQRRWLVTGASRGLGHAIATLAHEHGDKVCFVARSPDIAELAAALGPDALGVQADVSSADDLAGAVATMVERWGGVDVLVNNAGLHRGGKISAFTDDDWDKSLATNLSGPMYAVRAALPHMEPGGAIINVGAVVGFRGFPGDSCYGASKAGLSGLTQVLASELAVQQIRVNLVVPGFVMTELTSGVSEHAKQKIISKIPMRRMGEAEEIADVVWWVAGSSYMTGSVIVTDGGLMCNL